MDDIATSSAGGQAGASSASATALAQGPVVRLTILGGADDQRFVNGGENESMEVFRIAYAAQAGLVLGRVTLYYGKKELQADHTPASLGLQSGAALKASLSSLNFMVQGPRNGDSLNIRLGRHALIGGLRVSLEGRFKVSPGALRLFWDERRLGDTDTPESVGMWEGDTIDALVEQTGG